MRVFLIEWAGECPETAEAVYDLKEKGHTIVYWTRSSINFTIDRSRFPNTIFHDYNDVVAAKPAPGVNVDNFSPIGEDFIKKFLEYESELITMMNKKYEWMTINERKHLFYHYLWYWNGVIEKYKPELIIFQVATHTLYDFVLYGLAKYYKIPTFMFEVSVISPYLLTINDYHVGSQALRVEMQKLKTQDISLSQLAPILRDYFIKSLQSDAPPDYLKMMICRYSGITNWLRIKSKMVFNSLKDFSIFKKIVEHIYKKMSSNLRDEYLRVQVAPDFNKKFIYVALHYQPECATSPLGGIFVDQILMIEILSAALPDDWVVYVKEHPLQWHPRGKNFTSYRYRGYYEHISKIKNVFIVQSEISGYVFIRNCQAVATVTGSSAWEGILKKKPAIIFGYPWYRDCPGVLKVNDVKSCRDALARIIKGDIIREQDIIKYLYALEKASVQGCLDSYSQKASRLSPQTNRENLLNAFLDEIKKITSSCQNI